MNGDVAYRKAVGRVEKAIWERLARNFCLPRMRIFLPIAAGMPPTWVLYWTGSSYRKVSDRVVILPTTYNSLPKLALCPSPVLRVQNST